MNSRPVSRVTSQNQISIPAEVRRRFRIVAGTELIWEERDGALIVRPKRTRWRT
jgi:AbrB family looped-hinge helix DNA binding protein